MDRPVASKLNRWLQRLIELVLVVVLGCAVAAPVAGQPLSVADAARRAAAAPMSAPIARSVMAGGADVDGDGAVDFINPTGQGLRDVDGFGSGAFLASRDGGSRDHVGADFLNRPGQDVAAPISGYVTKIGFAYDGDARFRYVELTNRAIGYVARVFYLTPTVEVGQAVRLGRTIGTALSLQDRYPGISDHVHVETTEIGVGRVDPAKLIPSPVLRFAAR